jgi:hypothetical protein
VAERLIELLELPLATPIQTAAIQHDPGNRLVLDFYHANGRNKVTVPAAEGRVRVEVWRASLWKYLSTLHVTTAAFRSGDARMQLWAWYNEFAHVVFAGAAGGSSGWMETLNRLHRLPGAWRGYPWVGLPGVVSLGLWAIGASGLFPWLEKRSERRAGGAMLAPGVGLTGTLIVWMRAG